VPIAKADPDAGADPELVIIPGTVALDVAAEPMSIVVVVVGVGLTGVVVGVVA
jgi:hypothetical protein